MTRLPAALLALLAACGPGRPELPDSALEAYQRGDFERAETLLGSPADPESALLKARILLLRNHPGEAARILLPFTRGRHDVSVETLLHQELALAALRADDFAAAARAFHFLGETVAARKYDTLARRVGYVSELDGPEAAADLLSADPVPLVVADANGVSGLFLVDTALDEVLLDRDFARKARAATVGLQAGAFRRSYDEAILESLEIGRLRVRNVPARLGAVSAPEGVRADGAIGLSLLLRFDFTLDLRRGRLVFRRPAGPSPLPRGVPAFWAGDRTLLVRGSLRDGTPALAAVASSLPGTTIAASPAVAEGTEFRLGGLSLSVPRSAPAAFPENLGGAFGFPVHFVLGAGALRGRALRVDPRSMTAALD
ncbi:MAG TPA: aspartyl protease family protein [Planctomycetota bacterium]|nr:aspartyl protease family protein [Planctomycetota bacterium]